MKDISYKLLGQRIRAARNKKGLTQAELADRVGKSDSHISHIELGKTKASLETTMRIFEVLDISSEEGFCDQLETESASMTYSQELASRFNLLSLEEQRLVMAVIDSLEKSNSK